MILKSAAAKTKPSPDGGTEYQRVGAKGLSLVTIYNPITDQ